jgi:hypothetical protein
MVEHRLSFQYFLSGDFSWVLRNNLIVLWYHTMFFLLYGILLYQGIVQNTAQQNTDLPHLYPFLFSLELSRCTFIITPDHLRGPGGFQNRIPASHAPLIAIESRAWRMPHLRPLWTSLGYMFTANRDHVIRKIKTSIYHSPRCTATSSLHLNCA